MSVIEVPQTVKVSPVVTTRDVFHRAADLIEEFGWCQNEYGSKEQGGMCAIGAVVNAAHDYGDSREWKDVEDHYNDHVLEVVGRNRGFVCQWNDEPGRTKDEVVAALREAAEASA